MHATHLHGMPRRTLAAGAAALALGAMAVALPSQIADSSFGLGGGDRGAQTAAEPPTSRLSSERPLWVTDPLASPLTALRAER